MSIQSLRTGYTGLTASQLGIDTTSNNIANANTDGYTRQRVDQSELPTRDIIIGRVGQGTRVDDISRARDAFLDERVRAATARTASSDINAELLSRIESLLGEPDFGVTAALDELWAGFEDLSLDPSDQGRRTAVRNQLDVVASRFNAISDGVDRLVADTSTRALGTITQINDLVAEVASLNEAIARSSANGSTPNDLLDRRDLALDGLVEQLGARITHQPDGNVRVSVNGLSLVDGTSTRELSWDVVNHQLLHENGTVLRAGGHIGGLQKTIETDAPAVLAQLDALAADLTSAVNARHQAGFSDTGTPGGALFSHTVANPAGSLTVVLANIDDFALSAVDGTPFPIHNGDNARSISDLRGDLVAGGGTASLMDASREFVADIGGRTAAARAAADAQADLQVSAELARESAHGINLDEEMIELIRYQRAYEAAARVITAADQALDTLINRTGIVGR